MKTCSRLAFSAIILFALVNSACQKKTSNPAEATLTVQTSPVTTNNNVEAPAPGPDFPLNVTITSAMPSKGVKIDVTARQDGSATTFFSESRNTSTASNSFTITSTPKTVICLVDVVVTSLSSSSNKWTGSYRYSRK